MPLRARSFVDADIAPLQAALASWIHDAGPVGYCHVGEIPHRIYENLRGRLPVGEMVRVWEDDSLIAGVAICGRFDRSFDVFTSPALRGKAAELDMLRTAEATTRAIVSRIDSPDRSVVTDVFARDDPRIRLLGELGFERYRLWDHIVTRDLLVPLPEPSGPDGFGVRLASVADAAGLARARNDSFGSDWTSETYCTQVLEKPGSPPEREIVMVAPDGQIAAFADVWIDSLNRVGHFEPVGTHRAFRRRGLARAAMIEGLKRMRRLGMETATVEYDAENTAAAALYRGLGFEPLFEVFGYRR